MPPDAVEISQAEYRRLLDGRLAGLLVAMDGQGFTLVSAPVNNAAAERAWRDAQLALCVWMRDRHRDQLEIGVDTTLSTEQFSELLVYMQALRDWPQSDAFPDAARRPQAPPWIADQTQ
ncbi:phage tail protein [Pseudomonas putida]|nr:phage tail protein [Pseudomonas putida]